MLTRCISNVGAVFLKTKTNISFNRRFLTIRVTVQICMSHPSARQNLNVLTGYVKTELTRLIPRLPGLSDTKWSGDRAFCTCRLCVQSKLPTEASVRWWNLPDAAFKHALCLELKLYRRKLNVGKILHVTLMPSMWCYWKYWTIATNLFLFIIRYNTTQYAWF